MTVLLTPDDLEALLGSAHVRVLEASIARETYEAAHIPGALWIDHYADLARSGDDTQGYIIMAEQFAALMRRLGVTPGATVVWYGDRHNSYAARGLWTMDYYRHPAPVYVLGGGRERWQAEGRPMRGGSETVAPASYPVPASVNTESHATWWQVRDAIDARGKAILDVREPAEFDGSNLRAARGGHIPGAVNIEWTEATAGDNVLKPIDELRAMYAAHGVTPDREIIVHCQLGMRAAHTWFVLKHVLGYPSVRNYDGSWAEWGNRADLPTER